MIQALQNIIRLNCLLHPLQILINSHLKAFHEARIKDPMMKITIVVIQFAASVNTYSVSSSDCLNFPC